MEHFRVMKHKKKKRMRIPHVLAIPYPAQGHVIPLMELSLWLVKNGIKVTFVNTEFNHERVVKALPKEDNIQGKVNMVSIPDGLEPWEDRNELGGLTRSVLRVMPGKLEELIENINKIGDEIVCVIADWTLCWLFDVAEKLGIRRAAFWPGPAAVLALSLNIPKLIDDGIINTKGKVMKDETLELSPNIPLIDSKHFVWACVGDKDTQEISFYVMQENNRAIKQTEWIVCNSSHHLESGAFSLFPNFLPVGPLLAKNRLGKSVGYFWPEVSSCSEWLNQQPAKSVIYVAFGSFTIFDQTQFEELALGLELMNRPFLWVVRQDVNADTGRVFPEGFEDRVKNRGKIVSWAPQQEVLSHPSVACFVSHCGWNSTSEGIGSGLPFLCWPYFADQFVNQSYICDEWEVGLRFDKDESGIIRRGEIKKKVQLLLNDNGFKSRAMELQAKTAGSVRGGTSHENLNKFIKWVKEN